MQVALDGRGARLRALRATAVNVRPDGSAVVQYSAQVDVDGLTSAELLARPRGGGGDSARPRVRQRESAGSTC